MQQDLLDNLNRRIYTVSELNREVRLHLERGFTTVWLEGELSNLTRPASGHLYFTIKDRAAQVRCAMFRREQRALDFAPQAGQQVLAFARVSLYEPRGDYQLIVEQLEESGAGLLQRQFEQLKQRLQAEGLFDPAHKRALPPFPRSLGVITSPSGAALRDVLRVVARRAPWLPVVVYPSRVQGAGAAAELVTALARAVRHGRCDTLLLVRGGGSLEDLWAFNDERLARALHDCPIPVVAGVGHEIDFTIADFVADQRAPTPSVAAELATPDATELGEACGALQSRLRRAWRAHAGARGARLEGLRHRLQVQHPLRRVEQQLQRRDELQMRLQRVAQVRLDRARHALAGAVARLEANHPARHLPLLGARLGRARERMRAAARVRGAALDARLRNVARALDAVSPLATLARGYAIVTRHDDPLRPITSSEQVRAGELLEARLARGALHARVERLLSPSETDAGD